MGHCSTGSVDQTKVYDVNIQFLPYPRGDHQPLPYPQEITCTVLLVPNAMIRVGELVDVPTTMESL